MTTFKICLFLSFISFVSTEFQNDTNVISTNITLTRFLLWTPENPEIPQEILFQDLTSLQNSSFKSDNRTTKLLVHGYTGNGQLPWIIEVKNNFLKMENCNIISVDWEPLAGPQPWYTIASANAKKVGHRTAEFFKFLMENSHLSMDDIHIIGFSLGGQLVAFIGQDFNGELPRITALDPAGFLYHTADPEDKLTPDDAKFIDVIHSAGLWMGTDEKVRKLSKFRNN